ncbi:hypothetical protein IWX46DRAFT_104051 [Phyllosticta citricarpa]|uniref:Uncharacterized protein n=1 Tax=Phyllosticta citricarpa TaxID=55181 RepID=A0ABR1MFR3_9PEZI
MGPPRTYRSLTCCFPGGLFHPFGIARLWIGERRSLVSVTSVAGGSRSDLGGKYTACEASNKTVFITDFGGAGALGLGFVNGFVEVLVIAAVHIVLHLVARYVECQRLHNTCLHLKTSH